MKYLQKDNYTCTTFIKCMSLGDLCLAVGRIHIGWMIMNHFYSSRLMLSNIPLTLRFTNRKLESSRFMLCYRIHHQSQNTPQK